MLPGQLFIYVKGENCMGLLSKLFGKKKPPAAANPAANRKSPYLTQTVVFGMHLYRQPGEDSTVCFVDEKRGIRKKLVDSEGRILHFPGIVREDFWIKEVSGNALRPQIRFRTSFERRKDKWIMLWQIQPDGRYWEDEDGFGAENESEVTLYTYVDENGDFTGPFRIYSVGMNRYFREEEE